MAIQYGNKYVDDKYKSIVLPNLYMTNFLFEGMYQDASENAAGQAFWHKLGASGITAPGTPGRAFTDTDTADSLINVAFNNNYQRSEKIYGVQAAAVAYPIAEANLAKIVQEIAQDRCHSALGCLCYEGTASSDTASVTKSNIKDKILGERAGIVAAGGAPDVVLLSPSAYACLLGWSGTEFTPITNEKVIASNMVGRIGSFYGMTCVEVSGLAASADAKYYDYSGTLRTVDDATALNKVDFIIYDHNAFGVGDNFSMLRLIDSELFAGTKAQSELNSAFRVLNTSVVRVKSHT